MTLKRNNTHYPQLKPDEAALVAKYRNATPAGKASLRKLALRYRNTHPVVSSIEERR